jgi:uncharacterized protein (TIGR00251 family)
MIPDGLISGSADRIIIRLHLQPRASKTDVCGIQGDELKVKVTSPPVDDAANKLCIELFSRLFRTAKSNIAIISGQKSRHKRLQIIGATVEESTAIIAKLLNN